MIDQWFEAQFLISKLLSALRALLAWNVPWVGPLSHRKEEVANLQGPQEGNALGEMMSVDNSALCLFGLSI